VNELLAAARQEDIYGQEEPQPMISFHRSVGEASSRIAEVVARTRELAALPVASPDELSTSERRAIQIFTRRTGASSAQVSPLSGGLSGAKTVVIDASDFSGMRTAHVVGKLAPVGTIPSAVDGYENAMPYLPAGLGAALAGCVKAGAGDLGGVFFRLADDYRRSYFECLTAAPADAAEAVRRLHERFADQYGRAPVERVTADDVRKGVISDAELREAVAPVPNTEDVEGIEVEVARGIQHRDLHGLNVLVSDSNEPLLIDYDNYAPANCALDPVTLELSAIFHRDAGAQRARRGWPGVQQAAAWFDLDAYLEDCPYPDAIRACRAWAEDAAASPRELAATLLSVAMRQFWFENTDKSIAEAMISAGREGLS
jgi:hypothetical protein